MTKTDLTISPELKVMNQLFSVFIILFLSSNISWSQSFEEQHILNSKHLSEDRIISVSLPAAYKVSQKSYPVLYVLDGEYIFSYARGTVDFLSNDFGYLPEMIVVGIPNAHRYRDMYVTFNESDSFYPFIQFLEKEVFPFINDKYRTNGFEMLYGWSSGSAICTYFLATRPQLLNGYILTGSGIGRTSGATLEKQLSQNPFEQKTYLYVNVEDEAPRQKSFLKYQSIVESNNVDNLVSKFEIAKNTGHVQAMSAGLDAGLKFIFADFYIPDEVTLKGVGAIKEYYSSLQEVYGFEIDIPMGAINESASVLVNNDQPSTAIELLLYGTKIHPYAATLYGSLGEIHQYYVEQPELAREYYQKAMKLSKRNSIDRMKYKTMMETVSK